MTYKILFSTNAKKQLVKLEKETSKNVLKKLYSIKHNPFPHLKKLKGSKFFRLRVQNLRVIIEVIVVEKKLFVLRIGKRSNVY